MLTALFGVKFTLFIAGLRSERSNSRTGLLITLQSRAGQLMAKQTGSSYSMPHGAYAQMSPVRHSRGWHAIGVPTLPRWDGGIESLG